MFIHIKNTVTDVRYYNIISYFVMIMSTGMIIKMQINRYYMTMPHAQVLAAVIVIVNDDKSTHERTDKHVRFQFSFLINTV